MAEARSGYIQQLPSGSFRVGVYAGTDPLRGRQIRLRRTCKTERAAQIELGRLLEQAAVSRQPETDVSVGQLMDKYAEIADWDLSSSAGPFLATCGADRPRSTFWPSA